MVTDTTLFGLIHDYFKVYLPKYKNCSTHTIRSYRKSLDSLLEFVKESKKIALFQITFEMIDSEALADFLDDLELKGNSIATRNQRLNCIRAFFAYAAKVNTAAVIHAADIAKVPLKISDKPDTIDYLSEDAIGILLEQPDPHTRKGLRDRFFMLLLYDTGARLQEILDIRLKDVQLGSKTPTVILSGKGRKIRTVPLMKSTTEHLENYMNVFHPDEDKYSERYLFYAVQHRQQNPLSQSAARKLIREYGNSAKNVCSELPDIVHPHLLRHSRAMHLYRRGMDLTLVQQWLGHSKLDTTYVYAYADTETKRAAIENSTDPKSPLKKKLNSERFTITDDETLKLLYGLKE